MAPQSKQFDADAEANALLAVFEQKETEDTWIQMDDALSKFVAVVKEDAHSANFVALVRKLKKPILLALNTERTRLARTAMLLCEVLGQYLEDRFEGLSDFILPALLRLCTRANKVIVTTANNTLKVIIDYAGVPSLVTLISENICTPSPSKTLRISSAECLNRILGANAVNRVEKFVEPLEAAIKSGTVDSTPEVRGLIKSTFELYKEMFPMRIDRFIDSLPEVAAKYLKVNKNGMISRKPQTRPRAPTASSSVSSGALRALPARTASVTPDNFSVTSRDINEDDAQSLESETPSFGVEQDEADTIKLRSKPIADLEKIAPRRMLMERPSRDGGMQIQLHDHLGGAQRVPKMKNSSSNTSLQSATSISSKPKALRVPAVAPAAEQTPKPVQESAEAPPTVVTVKDTKIKRTSIPKQVARENPAAAKIDMLDFAVVSNHLKSTEWTVRVGALEQLCNYVRAASLTSAPSSIVMDVRSKSMKYCDCLMVGLMDNQPKCVLIAMTGILTLMQSPFALPEMIDHVIPRISGIALYQPQKSKSGVVELAHTTLKTCVEYFGIEVCAMACNHALNNHEFGKVVKVRAGSIAMLAEMNNDEWALILQKSSNTKLYMTRLLSQSTDLDATIQKSLKICLATIHAQQPDAFWNIWAGVKPTEKKAVNAMFQTSDIQHSKSMLSSAKTKATGFSSAVKSITLSKIATPLRPPTSNPQNLTARISHDLLREEEDDVTPSLSRKKMLWREQKASPTREADTSHSNLDRNQVLSRLVAYDDESDPEVLENENLEGDDLQGTTGVELEATSPIDSDADEAGASTCEELESAASRVDGIFLVSNETKLEGSEEPDEINFTGPLNNHSFHSTRGTPASGAFGSRLPRGESTSKIARSGIPLFSPHSTPLPSRLVQQIAHTTGKISKSGKFPDQLNYSSPVTRGTSSLSTAGTIPSPSHELSAGDAVAASNILNALAPARSTLATIQSTPASTKSISFGTTTVIDETEKGECQPFHQHVSAAAFDIALQGTFEDLWCFAREKRYLDVFENHLDNVLDVVVHGANESERIDVPNLKCGLYILNFIVEHFAVDERAADVFLAALELGSESNHAFEDQLDIACDLDNLMAIFKQTFDTKTLISCALHALEANNDTIDTTMCIEIITWALNEASRIEGGGSDDVLFGGDSEKESSWWNRVIVFVAKGLDSDAAAMRRAAFECAMALIERKGDSTARQLFATFGKQSGRVKELVFRGMIATCAR